MRSQRLAGSRHRIGRMSIIHVNRSPVGACRSQLHAPAHGLQFWQNSKHTICRRTAGNHQPSRNHHVFRLKSADKVQPRLKRLATELDPHILPGRVKPLREQCHVGPGIATDGHNLLPARPGNRQHINPTRIIDIDHRDPVFGQNACEEPRLGVEIRLEALVVIQMILCEIGEARCAEVNAVQPPLCQSVRRRLHSRMFDPGLYRAQKCAVQGNGLRCRMRQGRFPIAFHTGGAKIDRRMSQQLPDTPHETGNTGFAIGAGDGHNRIRLIAKPKRCRKGQCLARVSGNHHGCR